ncbi:MAG: HEAT repeat domain-containing protein [Planctomycetota bacterium]|nr:MAG: HEAT repeat domain-containing protein [Planctomycetota bacterium]
MPGKEKPKEKTSIIRRGLLAPIRTAGMAVGVLKNTAGALTSKIFSIMGMSRNSRNSEPADPPGNCHINLDITEKLTFKESGANENRAPVMKTRKTVPAKPIRKLGEVKFYRKLLDKTNFRLSTHKETFRQAIHNLIYKPNNRVARLNAARLLSQIPGENPLSILIRLAQDECEKTRAEAVGILASRRNVDLAVFARALKDENVRVRLAAVKGIYRKNGKKSTELLLDALADEHAAVRRRAVLCLGWRREPGTALRIAALLKNGDVSVRKAAAGALGSIKEKSAVELLIEAVGDEDAEVRKMAHKALEKITGRSLPSSVERQEPRVKKDN